MGLEMKQDQVFQMIVCNGTKMTDVENIGRVLEGK
jgi:hypothetical protein